MLELIGQYCQRIKSLDFRYYSNDSKTLDFFRIYGRKLEELILRQFLSGSATKEILDLCPNIKKLAVGNILVLFNKDKNFLPKLEYIGKFGNLLPNEQYIRVFKANQLKILTDKYSRTLKTLNVSFWHMGEEEPKPWIKLISRLENLRQLSLELGQIITTQPIDDCLSLIGQKCTKLLKLDFRINILIQISKRFFYVFYHFAALKELKIS